MVNHQRPIYWLLILLIGCGGLATFELLGGHPALAQDETSQDSEQADSTPSISALKTELHQKVSDLKDLYQDAADESERQEIVRKRRFVEAQTVDKVIQLTRQRDNSYRNIRDLVWFFKQTKGIGRTNIGDELTNKYIESKDLTDLVLALDRVPSPSAENESWMRQLIKKSPHVIVQGRATMVLADYLKKIQLEIESTTDERSVSSYLKSRTNKELASEIEALLTQCADKYADVKSGRKKIGDIAAEKLIQMNLLVGKVAPDIVGLDLDENQFCLSDYRGKVVVIDFWGDW